MLSPVEIAAIVAATKGAVDLFDRIGGQIKSALNKAPKKSGSRAPGLTEKQNACQKGIVRLGRH